MKITRWLGWKIKFLFTRCHQLAHEQIDFSCGHTSTRKAIVLCEGEKSVCTLGKDTDNSYCPQCMTDRAIRCWWCNCIIMPGDDIKLETLLRDENVPETATWHDKSVIGCAGCFCTDSLLRKWVMPGKVEEPAHHMQESSSPT